VLVTVVTIASDDGVDVGDKRRGFGTGRTVPGDCGRWRGCGAFSPGGPNAPLHAGGCVIHRALTGCLLPSLRGINGSGAVAFFLHFLGCVTPVVLLA